jgi:hypothetical protein
MTNFQKERNLKSKFLEELHRTRAHYKNKHSLDDLGLYQDRWLQGKLKKECDFMAGNKDQVK